FSALYAAIAVSKSLPLVRLLLEAGANPNDGQSMYHAAEQWTNDALDLLVAHGASHQELSYCLKHKIDFNHEPGIRRFLEHGADPNPRTTDGHTAYPAIVASTPLDLAERLGRVEISLLLRRHGAERALVSS